MPRRINYAYRCANAIMNARLATKTEVEDIVDACTRSLNAFSRPALNAAFGAAFLQQGWRRQPVVGQRLRLDFLKDRVGVEVAFTHASFMGGDFLKFEIAANANLIDVAVYIATTRALQRLVTQQVGHCWGRSASYDRAVELLPSIQSAIHIPIFVIGIDV